MNTIHFVFEALSDNLLTISQSLVVVVVVVVVVVDADIVSAVVSRSGY